MSRMHNDSGENATNNNPDQIIMRFDDLNARQRRGLALWARAQISNGMMILITDDCTLWYSGSDSTRSYQVVRTDRNRRGRMACEYRCQCQDFAKHGALPCKHIFAEQLRREEVKVIGAVKQRAQSASRRPARKRLGHDGRSIRSVQRDARQEMPERIPQLIHSLGKAFNATSPSTPTAVRGDRHAGGRPSVPLWIRAVALIYKVAERCSADAMQSKYRDMIARRILPLRNTPSPNALTTWMNDESLTPVLEEFLRMTAEPFRQREVGAIIDSSKISQMLTAHSRHVEYGSDERDTADWAKCHALVGVETLVVMAVMFSGSFGLLTHDVNFLKPLIEKAQQSFPLEFILGDKAYLSEDVLAWLWRRNIKAVIPLKKRWFRDENKTYHVATTRLVEWFDQNNNVDFHEQYRLRPKVEALFSLVKRAADGYCWSRGRKRQQPNAKIICTAWKNELLCKFIFVNLRTTVSLEGETGCVIDYQIPGRRFPRPDDPLLGRAA